MIKTMTAAVTAEKEAGKLSFIQKVGYGFGEVGSQFSWGLIGSYLTIFYTDVVGLAPIAISAIMLIARVWDAINDPMFGAIAERTSTKWGRYRPYILFGSPLLALFNCLTFLNLDVAPGLKGLWCGITYIGCGMLYTAVNLSFGCLVNNITEKNEERVSCNGIKGVMGCLTTMVLNAVTMPLILYFGGGSTSSARGYFFTALICSIACIPCFFICFFSTKEIIGVVKIKKELRGLEVSSDEMSNIHTDSRTNVLADLIHAFQKVFKERNAAILLIGQIVFCTALFGRMGIMSYFFVYVMGNPALMATAMTLMSLGMMLSNVIAMWMCNHINKKTVGLIGTSVEAVICIIFFFLGQQKAEIPIIVISFLFGICNIAALVGPTLASEIIDDNWLKTGERSDGIIMCTMSFSSKLSNAIAGSVGILALSAVGYAANTQMSASTLTNINAVINIAPAVLFVAAGMIFFRIDMTNEKSRSNEEKIRAIKTNKL